MVFLVELKVSNNDDTLSTQIAFMVQVELLVLLIDVDSFYTANPIHYPAAKGLNLIEKLISDSLEMVEAASLEAEFSEAKLSKSLLCFISVLRNSRKLNHRTLWYTLV